MNRTGLTDDAVKNIAWHSASLELDVSHLLSSKAFDIIEWEDDPALLSKKRPTKTDLKKYGEYGIQFWLTRFALAAWLTIDSEAKTSATAARAWGARWIDVGDTIGMSRQGAQQRYGK